jgi:hypothetical protein
MRALHANSVPQATHHEGRTIRSASRPKEDNALAIRLGTRTLYLRGRMTLMTRFAIVAAMKRASLLLALTLFSALPLLAQSSHEFGILVGGSRRFIDNGLREGNVNWLDSSFSFSNGAIDLYWAQQIESDVYVKFNVGRIETQIAEAYTIPGIEGKFRRDAEGEVQHADAIVEYRFSEPYGSTSLFGGLGFYRQSADGLATTNNFGWNVGVNGDFPLTKRYGVVVQGAYYWTNGDFRPRYMTVSGGLRVSF